MTSREEEQRLFAEELHGISLQMIQCGHKIIQWGIDIRKLVDTERKKRGSPTMAEMMLAMDEPTSSAANTPPSLHFDRKRSREDFIGLNTEDVCSSTRINVREQADAQREGRNSPTVAEMMLAMDEPSSSAANTAPSLLREQADAQREGRNPPTIAEMMLAMDEPSSSAANTAPSLLREQADAQREGRNPPTIAEMMLAMDEPSSSAANTATTTGPHRRKKPRKTNTPFRVRITKLMSRASWPNPGTFVVSKGNTEALNADLTDPVNSMKKRLRLRGFELLDENNENMTWRHLRLTQTNWQESVSIFS